MRHCLFSFLFDPVAISMLSPYVMSPSVNQFSGEISFELKDPAYCYVILKRPDDFNALSANITKWLSEVENSKVLGSFLSCLF